MEIIKVKRRELVKYFAERGESHIQNEELYIGSLSPGRCQPGSIYLLGGVKTRRVPVIKVRYRPLDIFVDLDGRHG